MPAWSAQDAGAPTPKLTGRLWTVESRDRVPLVLSFHPHQPPHLASHRLPCPPAPMRLHPPPHLPLSPSFSGNNPLCDLLDRISFPVPRHSPMSLQREGKCNTCLFTSSLTTIQRPNQPVFRSLAPIASSYRIMFHFVPIFYSASLTWSVLGVGFCRHRIKKNKKHSFLLFIMVLGTGL